MNEAKKIRKKRKKRKVNKIITLILIITILIFFVTMFYINIIPVIFTILSLILFLGITFGLLFLNFNRKRFFRLIGYILSVILISLFVFIEIYLFNTLGFLFNVTDGDYALKVYNIIVLKNSNCNDLKDLKNETIGISETIEEETLRKIKKQIKKNLKINYEMYDDTNSLVNGLTEEKIEGIILENSEIELLKEQDNDKYEELKIIKEIEIKNDIKDLKNAVNINREPFNVYISGIDTFGKINSSSRSDVNIILTVNPKTEKVLITWLPRDYYVNINDTNYKDKLTHAGIYGINSSVYAIEHLLDIDINYYVKVNFTSLIEIVDILGGITVYNDSEFVSSLGNTFKSGNITLNGKETLEFVRERKQLSTGDLGRGQNQIKVLEALMNKAMSPSIIKSYNSILNSLDGAFITNIKHNTMLGFIKKELSNPRDWIIESNILSGTNSLEYTYTYKSTELYVMIPDSDSINKAKNKIDNIRNKKS